MDYVSRRRGIFGKEILEVGRMGLNHCGEKKYLMNITIMSSNCQVLLLISWRQELEY